MEYKKIIYLLIFLLSACNFPGLESPDAITLYTLETKVPTQEHESTECAFVWARNPLPEISEALLLALKEVQPQAQGFAEAYGENCIKDDGKVVRFLARETDFHVTLTVDDLEDKKELGELIERVIDVLSKFPTTETPGPQPGYLGITFETPDDGFRMWFPIPEAEIALKDGFRGAELFDALQRK